MKVLFLTCALFFVTSFVEGQVGQVFFEESADVFAKRLNSACSSASKDLDLKIYWDSYEKNGNLLSGRMEVSWVGSFTGSYYWIKGKLKLDLNDGMIHWYKSSDSGGFPNNCSRKLEKRYYDIVVH